jgi:flavin reductase (DIM6/NTAB) family NADH-FMN oxidoreductase RutF
MIKAEPGGKMDKETRKTVLRKIPYGLYVIGVKRGSEVNAFTGSWFSQVSMTPPMVMLGVEKKSMSLSMMRDSKVFSVNFLLKSQKDLAGHFVKPAHRVGDKFGEIPFSLGRTGTPILDSAPYYLECEVREIAEGGDHAVVIGEVVEVVLRQDAEPLVMSDTPWHYGG